MYSVCNMYLYSTWGRRIQHTGCTKGGEGPMGGAAAGKGERLTRTQSPRPSNSPNEPLSSFLCFTCSITILLLLPCRRHLLPPLFSFPSAVLVHFADRIFHSMPVSIPSLPVLAVLLYLPPRKPWLGLPAASVFPSVCPYKHMNRNPPPCQMIFIALQ